MDEKIYQDLVNAAIEVANSMLFLNYVVLKRVLKLEDEEIHSILQDDRVVSAARTSARTNVDAILNVLEERSEKH
jgi:hypothetical protein